MTLAQRSPQALQEALLTLSTGFSSRILVVDEAFTEMTGWPAAEAVGENMSILFGPWSNRGVVDRLMRALEQGEAASNLELKLYRHDGTIFEASVTLSADAVSAATVQCIIRLRGASASGTTQRGGGIPPAADRLLPVLLDSLRDIIVVVDERDVILMVNQAFLQLVDGSLLVPVGSPASEFITMRPLPEGDTDGVTAATIHLPGGGSRSASVSVARGVDQAGQMFRVLTLRPAAATTTPGQVGARLDTSADVFERALLKQMGMAPGQIALGLIEIAADDDLEADLGSIWHDTLAAARTAAASVLAAELRAGEMFTVVEEATFVMLILHAAGPDDAQGRVEGIAQVVRQRLIGEGGAVAAFEAFGGATMLDQRAAAIAAPRPNAPGELVRRLVSHVRQAQNPGLKIASIIADMIDGASVVPQPVRGRDMGVARFAIARFDERSRRWLAWADRRHRIEQSHLDELDIALLGRVVERSFSAGDFSSLIVPLHYQALVHAVTADRLSAIVRGLSQGVRVRLHAMVRGLPGDLHGERLFAFVRRLAGFGRGVWLVLDGLDSHGIQGRQEGLAGVALDYANLGPLIDREPLAVKQFIERLRGSNQPVLVFGVQEVMQASLLFNTFGVTLMAGAGVERLAAQGRALPPMPES